MGTKVEAPKPTAEERALQAEQAALLSDQREILQAQLRQQELLSPLLFEQLGVTPTVGADGQITGFEKTGLSQQSEQIQSLLNERSLAALRGELPVSPTLERELGERQQTLENTLRDRLGTGFDISSPGIEALARERAFATEAREGARTGQLTLAEQLGLSRGGFQAGLAGQQLATVQSPLNAVGAGSSLANSFGGALSSYQNQRAMELNAALANQQSRSQTLSGLFSGIGTIAGLGLAGGFGGFGGGGITSALGFQTGSELRNLRAVG